MLGCAGVGQSPPSCNRRGALACRLGPEAVRVSVRRRHDGHGGASRLRWCANLGSGRGCLLPRPATPGSMAVLLASLCRALGRVRIYPQSSPIAPRAAGGHPRHVPFEHGVALGVDERSSSNRMGAAAGIADDDAVQQYPLGQGGTSDPGGGSCGSPGRGPRLSASLRTPPIATARSRGLDAKCVREGRPTAARLVRRQVTHRDPMSSWLLPAPTRWPFAIKTPTLASVTRRSRAASSWLTHCSSGTRSRRGCFFTDARL